MMNKVMLMILDGWGIGKEYDGNCIYLANTPNMDLINKKFPNTKIKASGEYVGLPKGQMGNSEVGHLTIGSGRVIYQDLSRINKEIENGEFKENTVLKAGLKNVKDKNSSLHLMGLVSFGGVHSHINHLIEIVKVAKDYGIDKIYIHAFLDGRDVPTDSGIKDIAFLEEQLKEIGAGKIISVSGRYYAMDRDKRWDRTKKAYDAINYRIGNKKNTALDCIKDSYNEGITDEFVVPTVITSNLDENRDINILEDDTVIFFNFRPDRARQLTRAFTENGFNEFDIEKYSNLDFLTMTEYDAEFKNVKIIYPNIDVKNTLGEVLARNNKKQLRIAETEKYAHVTFFFNGGIEKPNENEDRILVPSPKVATYDLKPEMSSDEIEDIVIKKINENIYDVIILNFANPDMVGHTANIQSTIKAIERIDYHVGNIAEATLKNGYTLLITADHGNAEKLLDDNNKPFTSHTSNLVPFIVVSGDKNIKLKDEGSLKDISPTILKLLNIHKPKEMTGDSLII